MFCVIFVHSVELSLHFGAIYIIYTRNDSKHTHGHWDNCVHIGRWLGAISATHNGTVVVHDPVFSIHIAQERVSERQRERQPIKCE